MIEWWFFEMNMSLYAIWCILRNVTVVFYFIFLVVIMFLVIIVSVD